MKRGFNDVVLVVTQDQLAATEFAGHLEQALASVRCAQKARIFAVFGAVRLRAEISALNPEPISGAPAIAFQPFAKSAVKTGVEVGGVILVALADGVGRGQRAWNGRGSISNSRVSLYWQFRQIPEPTFIAW